MKNVISCTILAMPPIIAIAAFSLESRYTYGIQDRGLAKHRKKLRMIGRVAVGVSVLVLAFMLISLLKHHR
ncbi:hypothetical protein SAMN04515675_6101 [Pseudomonas costantinii]|uniref:Uncharacterized protein n=1 Tax=Pseudomonas costantinii TaxID=168469 RepID=A0A1S2UHT0_9PSED|nr:hypothetical protein BFL40_27640 [Pseudomonas costantinii]SEE53700.1 hypothetical protein SAMN04515675_6101 [Pseudomonas costantinii]